jgi:hypothetical protein
VDGSDDGCLVGALLGSNDGCALGILLGDADGCALGSAVPAVGRVDG